MVVCAAPAGPEDVVQVLIDLLLKDTTVSSTGDKALKLLKDPRGVLDSFPEDSFTITGIESSDPFSTVPK